MLFVYGAVYTDTFSFEDSSASTVNKDKRDKVQEVIDRAQHAARHHDARAL